MTTLMRILKLGGKASLQVLKSAVSLAAGTVVTFFLLYGWIALVVSERWLVIAAGAMTFVVLPAAFVGCFYLTFRLLEPRMIARKKALVASLGIVLPLALFFSLRYVGRHSEEPAPDIAEFFRVPSPPEAPKPKEEAIYDVYSDLFQQPPSLWDRLTFSALSPRTYSRGVAIVDETRILPDGGVWPEATLEEFQDRHSYKFFKLQRKFSLPNYVLITKTEEDHILREDEECLAFQRNNPGYRFIELYGVDFNKDQTRASITMRENWKSLCKGPYGGSARYLELEKNRHGKWRVKENHELWVACPG